MNKIPRYIITNPDFLQIEDIFKNHIRDYNKKFVFRLIYVNGNYTFRIESLVLKPISGVFYRLIST